MEYKTIAKNGMDEQIIKKSRFICHLARVETEEDARDFIMQIKKEHYKANHNCSAFIIGEKSEIKRTSDDGEPSGTAGVPMLGVLENLELTNVVAVVTRYFGGTKLGAGGLIRAYASSVSQAVQAIGRIEIKEQQGIRLRLTYAQYQVFSTYLKNHSLNEVDPQFTTDVETEIFVNKEETHDILDDLTEFFQGKASIETSKRQEIEVPLI
ncbi:YigZ family protein [Streptococcus moroccensis]|uniref:YigZ family protein n=1 Tax=Streptococcus moroccensis TaxID=1451356 RepID=A0ABT9YTJ6_9STRE|nr:YigZ family protein [Streptococcus moroccensis]MDQ0223315.1 putative YigZ family protein [Streptococcus moroccensis]